MLDPRELELFLSRGLTEHMWSVETRRAYARDLELYLDYLEETGVPALSRSSSETIVAFLESRRRAGDSETTRARRRAALRSFHRFLLEEGVIREDVLARLPKAKRTKTLPHYLSPAETRLLFDACQGAAPLARRDLAVLELLYATGMRVSELTGLTLAAIQAGGRDLQSIKVMGKGRKERFVPVHPRAVEALGLYLKFGRPRLARPDSPANLFLGRGGRALSRNAIYKRLRRLGLECGIATTVTPHLLRHTFATHLVHGGADLRSVQEMLGHANLDTTTIYTSVDAERLKKVHSRAHPRA